MNDLLDTLLLPMLFSLSAGTYTFFRFPERRPQLLLNLILIQLVGAIGFRVQPQPEVLGLLCVHALVITALLAKHLQTPELAPVKQPVRRR